MDRKEEEAYRGYTDGRGSLQETSKVHDQGDMLCKDECVFVNEYESQGVFNDLGTKSTQQTMISSAKGWILEDEFRDTSIAILSLLFCCFVVSRQH
jgi:hypothetical protein